MFVTLELPIKLLNKLKGLSESRGAPLEEVILEAVYEYVGLSDPEAKAELHLKLCEKYLRDAGNLLTGKDYVQAGEKFWGAAAQIVKAVAAKRAVTLDTHAKLWDFIAKLRVELEDPEIGRLWASANSLHKNFYEAQVSPELVEDYAQDVKRLVEKLKKLI
ncbi:MAG: PaREP1 family protein [Candidatus Bathyarchaeia archaeon]